MEDAFQKDSDRKTGLAARVLKAGFNWLAQPAPDKSLYSPTAAVAVAELLETHNNLFLAEVHDDVNYKFLVDNPEVFREAKAQNTNKLFMEMSSRYAPLYQAYYDGKVSQVEFDTEVLNFVKLGKFTSGDSTESMAKQMVALATKTKSEGIQILPSDFRDITFGVHRPFSASNYTSAAYGIPDVQGIDDAVNHQTMLSLEDYKNQYAATTGFDTPITASQQADFKKLHMARIEGLSEADKDEFKQDLQEREKLYFSDKSPLNLSYQNQLQFNYYTMVIQPDEKAMFMGGASHASDQGGIPDLLEKNGYGTTGSMLLMSNAGSIIMTGLDLQGDKVKNESIHKPYDFTAHTETGEITRLDGQKVILESESPIINPLQLNADPTDDKNKPKMPSIGTSALGM